MKIIIDEFDVNLYNYHALRDDSVPEGTVGIDFYTMTRDEDGYYNTNTHQSVASDTVFDPDYIATEDEDTWVYSHLLRGDDTGPVYDRVKKMHDNLVRQFEGSN